MAASLAITFLEAGVVGPVEIEVESLRSGRTAEAARATVRQGDRPILLASAWLADGWSTPAVTAIDEPFDGPGPEDGQDLSWLTDEWPALRFAERAGVDYPTSWLGFARGRPEIGLWARLVADPSRSEDPLPHAQMADVLHLDAHLFDAPGQVTGWTEADLLSLDLAIAWRPGAHLVPSTGWRLLRSRGAVSDGGVTAVGSVLGPDGTLLATATSQGLLRRVPSPH